MKYRPEIDGLRALAVIPVVLFHAGLELFSGGFVGVDIFFVISGFLITTILLKALHKGNFSIANFYERRARRILPALFVVMATCIPFAWAILLPSDLKEFAQSLIASTTFSSNIFFWLESDYFADSAKLKPLLHTWSLAVEEQYYIFFPLLLMAIWRWHKPYINAIFVLLALLSLAAAQLGIIYQPSASFYLLPMRGWELLIGVLGAMYQYNKPLGQNKSVDQVLSLIGLALIVLSIITYDESLPWPSLYAILPTFGALLIILFATQETLVARILSHTIMVHCGLISYSAYLWHQPIFAFARYYLILPPSPVLMLVLCVLVYGLAYITWRFVETPLRYTQASSRKVMYWSLSGIGLFLVVGFTLTMTTQVDKVTNKSAQKYFNYLAYNKSDVWNKSTQTGQCFLTSTHNSFTYFDKKHCLTTQKNKLNVFVFGDSHSAHYVGAMRTLYPDTNILQASSSGCFPLLPLAGSKRCVDLNNYIFKEFLPQQKHKLDVIVLAARWQSENIEKLPQTLDTLGKYAHKVLVIGPTVEYEKSLPRLLGQAEESRKNLKDLSTQFQTSERFILDQEFKAFFAAKNDKLTYISVMDSICNKDEKSCKFVTNKGVPVAFDYGHFTLEGAQYAIQHMKLLDKYLGVRVKTPQKL